MKYLFAVIFLVGLFFLSPASIQAHVLKTSGSMGVEMHISPDEDPVVGEQSDFSFEFKDKKNKFKLENCDCKISISASGKELYSKPLLSESFSYIFPKKDVYIVSLIGKPLTPDAFEDFTVAYEVHVEKTSKNTPVNTNIFLALLAIVILILIIIQVRRKRTTS